MAPFPAFVLPHLRQWQLYRSGQVCAVLLTLPAYISPNQWVVLGFLQLLSPPNIRTYCLFHSEYAHAHTVHSASRLFSPEVRTADIREQHPLYIIILYNIPIIIIIYIISTLVVLLDRLDRSLSPINLCIAFVLSGLCLDTAKYYGQHITHKRGCCRNRKWCEQASSYSC